MRAAITARILIKIGVVAISFSWSGYDDWHIVRFKTTYANWAWLGSLHFIKAGYRRCDAKGWSSKENLKIIARPVVQGRPVDFHHIWNSQGYPLECRVWLCQVWDIQAGGDGFGQDLCCSPSKQHTVLHMSYRKPPLFLYSELSTLTPHGWYFPIKSFFLDFFSMNMEYSLRLITLL